MKKITLLAVLVFAFNYSFGQEDLDRTGFKGEVSSKIKSVVNEQVGTEKEYSEESIIIFDSKTIVIGEETYEIVSKEFDGIDTNTFLCTKRGSNYTITYIVDDYISLVDNSNPNFVTYYMELTEE